MESLHNQRCKPFRADSQKLSREQAQQLLSDIPGWHIEKQRGTHRLVRSFGFDNFREAFEFAARITEIAEQENHHPVITVEWGKATIQWWTHSIPGLHLNDFIMAARTQMAAKK